MTDREVKDDDDLVFRCEGEFVGLRAAFALQGGASMKVSDLRSYTSSELMDHVMKHNGPDGLVLPWLDATNLRRVLRDYQSPTILKKAKEDSSSSPPGLVPGLFELIRDADVSTVNALVAPPDGKQWLCGLGQGKSMFVRECYDWFYKQAIKTMSEVDGQNLRNCPGLIYTGNPGIGKSTWLNYALVRFVQEGYAVVLERAKTHDYFVFQDGKCTIKEKRISLSVLSSLKKAVYLFDPDENESHPLESNVFTIVASSPQVKHYKALKKLGVGRKYFPCWSLGELEKVRPSAFDIADVGVLFGKWGRNSSLRVQRISR
jgi:hypothetical protein